MRRRRAISRIHVFRHIWEFYAIETRRRVWISRVMESGFHA